jgi:hypothetical protein
MTSNEMVYDEKESPETETRELTIEEQMELARHLYSFDYNGFNPDAPNVSNGIKSQSLTGPGTGPDSGPGIDIEGMIDLNGKSIEEIVSEDTFLQKIFVAFRSGLHPSMLDKSELNYINKMLGEDWYTYLGYTKADLNRIN